MTVRIFRVRFAFSPLVTQKKRAGWELRGRSNCASPQVKMGFLGMSELLDLLTPD
jgi:hypothetical protein